MKLNTSDIRNGKHVGEKVWICHYLRPNLDKKPLRNIKPTYVIIRDNDELPKNKKIYYSITFFSPLNKNNKLSNKVISPVDNTGYRSRPGNELHVFTTKEECIKKWNFEIKNCYDEFEYKTKQVEQERKLLLNMIID